MVGLLHLQPKIALKLNGAYNAPYNLKIVVSLRKTRNKSVCFVDLAIHSLGDGLQVGISLKIFVLFVFFVDEMIFLGTKLRVIKFSRFT